jgi:hypothetical protein
MLQPEYQNMTEQPERRTAAYLPWKTLIGIFAMLAAGMPHRVDRSLFRNFSGGVIAQILVGLRFLGLIEDDGTPTALLHSIVTAKGEEQKALLRQMIEAAYPDLIALDLTKVTRQMFDQKLGEYGLSGSTRRKGARFFLNAAEYLGIPLSPWLAAAAKPAGGVSSPQRPARRRRTVADLAPPIAAVTAPADTGSSVSIDLMSGGRVTLAAAVNFLTLSAADRAFVFDLIDRLNGYRPPIAEPEASLAKTEP